jgi:hypothetical protein
MKRVVPMGRFLVVILLLNCLAVPTARAEDFSFHDEDKQLHALATYGLTLAVSSLYRKTGMRKMPAFWVGMATVFGVGLLKETFYDKRFSNGDILANGIGTAAGGLTFLAVSF